MLFQITSKRIFLSQATLVLCLLSGPALTVTQAKDQWQRVYTGDDSIIELNTSSLRFEPGNVLRAEFRTVLSSVESIGGDRALKYKTRLEKIDFRLTDRRYRFFEISLLDASGKVIQTNTGTGAEDWRPFKPGGITERLFNAACVLSPLGAWKVTAYRFAEVDSKEVEPTPELDKLIGTAVHLHVDRAEVGSRVCRSPSFHDKGTLAEELLRQLRIDPKAIAIKADADTRVIEVKCEGSGWQPPQSLLIKENNKEEVLMLWEGVFLVLKRTSVSGLHAPAGIGLPTLKRRP